ncbi:YigZ family protein [Pasteurella canis]|uniref:YigZ family protein n=1 Tax=Pasteurella canis TaxID=753 RepID=UPI000D8FA963|nr:YigZ family protein [Pasteurella canis]SPY34186.1 IMPACT family member protein [Pasteurella canis]
MIEYNIPKSAVVFEEEIKKSRFITYLRHTEGIAEAKIFWQEIKTLHPNARHHCWATVAGSPIDSQQFGFSDDGEPVGTAGKPMLSVLQGSDIGEISAVIVRYYGGVLLGTGGLVRAYSNGVQQALLNLETTLKVQYKNYKLRSDYTQINWLKLLFEKYEILVIGQMYSEKVDFELGIRDDKLNIFEQEIIERSSGQLQLKRE